MHNVSERHGGEQGGFAGGDFFEDGCTVEFVGLGGTHVSPFLCFREFFSLGLGFEVSAAEDTPWRDTHPLGSTHAENVALKIPFRCGPSPLINDKGAKAFAASEFVGF